LTLSGAEDQYRGRSVGDVCDTQWHLVCSCWNYQHSRLLVWTFLLTYLLTYRVCLYIPVFVRQL